MAEKNRWKNSIKWKGPPLFSAFNLEKLKFDIAISAINDRFLRPYNCSEEEAAKAYFDAQWSVEGSV